MIQTKEKGLSEYKSNKPTIITYFSDKIPKGFINQHKFLLFLPNKFLHRR